MTKVSVYLAGASRQPARVLEWAAIIRSVPTLVLTSSWHDSDVEDWGGHDDRLPVEQQLVAARTCLAEIDAADILWLLWTPRVTRGALFEAGWALARGKRLMVTGDGCSQSIFTATAAFRDPCDSLGMRELVHFAARRRQQAERDAALSVVP